MDGPVNQSRGCGGRFVCACVIALAMAAVGFSWLGMKKMRLRLLMLARWPGCLGGWIGNLEGLEAARPLVASRRWGRACR
jgi:hypothetical protein